LPQHQRVQKQQTEKQTDGTAMWRIVFMIKCANAGTR